MVSEINMNYDKREKVAAMVAKMNAISLGSEMLDLNRMMASAPNIPKLSARLSPMDCIMVAVMTDINMRD